VTSALPGPIRILIADGDPLVCRALVHLLQEVHDIAVVGTAGTAETLLEQARLLHPAVVVIDARTAQLDGLTATRRLIQQEPATRVVVVSVYDALCEQALAAGACWCLLKDGSRAELVSAIRRAAQGQCQAATSIA
jgi:DNA-binding NarL/FixJ family response regulator